MTNVASLVPQPLVFFVLKPHCRKGRFNGIGCPYVDPVLGREVVVGKERIRVFGEAFTGPGELFAVERYEFVQTDKGLFFCSGDLGTFNTSGDSRREHAPFSR